MICKSRIRGQHFGSSVSRISWSSMALFCLGVYRSTQKCTCSKHGDEKSMRYRCHRCGEQRRRDHCKCKRDGLISGRAAGRRVLQAKAKAAPKAAPKALVAPRPVVAAGAVGRPSALFVEVLCGTFKAYRHASNGFHF